MKTDFSFLNNATPIEIGKYEDSYPNKTLPIPYSKNSYFLEYRSSGQRHLVVELDYDLGNAEERKAFNDMQLELYSLAPY